MPNDYSNFSLPDTGSTSAGQSAPPGYAWDGTRWVPKTTAPADVTRNPNARAWGGQDAATDASGNPIAGTSGGDQDYARFGALANAGQPGAVQIDQGASNESRGIEGGALGLLQNRANGGYTQAQGLARNQALGAVAGIHSLAASIKGGAGARAAAARGATATGDRVWNQAGQDRAALGAREQADAAGQYFGAATAQRGQDLGVATSQAQLEAQQRAANDQHKQHYDQAAWNTGNAQNNATLGVSGQDQAAENAARLAQQQASAVNRQQAQTAVSGGIGAIAGAAGAYDATTQKPPYDPNHTGSSEEMKTNIRPLGHDDAHPVGHDKGYRKTPRERLRDRSKEYDGKYGAGPFAQAKPAEPAKRSLEDAMSSYSEDAAPYAQHNGSPFGAGVPKNYAQDREGQPGAMFGGPAPEARHGYEPAGPHAGDAPGTEDYFAGQGHPLSKADRDIAMSDPKAKEDAFQLGIKQGVSLMSGDNGGTSGPRGKVGPSAGGHAASTSVARATPPGLRDEHGAAYNALGDVGDAVGGAFDKAVEHTPDVSEPFRESGAIKQPGPKTAHVERPAMTYTQKIEDQFGGPGPRAPTPPPPAEEPGYFGRYAPLLRSSMTSDPRAKTDMHGDPMAAANRSMAPSSYEYKPEFTPPEQQPGEKNVGPMANKMDADPIAKTAIVKDPGTGLLAIDKTKGLKLVMGGLADLQRQVDQMRGH